MEHHTPPPPVRIIAAMGSGFMQELARFGPSGFYTAFDKIQAKSYCARLARTHYENFTVASALLPRRLLPHFHAIYAYCRWADDLADETAGGAKTLELLQWWRAELESCYQGQPRHPVMVALSETIHQFHIPREPFLDLLHAFTRDQIVKEYETLSQLLDYCRFSANPVGRLVLRICDCYSEERAALSDNICTGLQLANFWQDVARDAGIGRTYLPRDERRRFGYQDGDLRAKRATPAFIDLMKSLVQSAREHFQRGLPLLDSVPPRLRMDIELFARGGQAILTKIERQGYNVWARRPRLDKSDKARLIARVAFRNFARLFVPGKNGSSTRAILSLL
jgi:squalene synthase HpnC